MFMLLQLIIIVLQFLAAMNKSAHSSMKKMFCCSKIGLTSLLVNAQDLPGHCVVTYNTKCCYVSFLIQCTGSIDIWVSKLMYRNKVTSKPLIKDVLSLLSSNLYEQQVNYVHI